MFHPIADRSYIVVQRKLNQTQARRHCFKNGSLWRPKNLSDCENFNRFMSSNGQNSRKRYWTGLCKNETDGNELCNTVVLVQLHNCNSNSDECVSVKIRGADAKHRLEECDDRKYFVCQVNKGNEIFSCVINIACM